METKTPDDAAKIAFLEQLEKQEVTPKKTEELKVEVQPVALDLDDFLFEQTAFLKSLEDKTFNANDWVDGLEKTATMAPVKCDDANCTKHMKAPKFWTGFGTTKIK